MARVVALSCVLIALFSLTSCTTSRYSMKQDKAPEGAFDASQVPDAIPKWEPLSRSGNKSPYEVLGKAYTVMTSAEGYREEGISSWYGLKFHGELTSNGEVYNMYELTAAHKSLPLPSYLRVTNLENDLSIVVRVNDRGPFHEDRIIDLSYAAAIKLGFQKKGTARVKLEAITVPRATETNQEASSEPDRLAPFIQVAAFSSSESAEKVKQSLLAPLQNAGVSSEKLFIAKSPDRDPAIYRLRIGPFDSEAYASEALKKVKSAGMKGAIVITRSLKGAML